LQNFNPVPDVSKIGTSLSVDLVDFFQNKEKYHDDKQQLTNQVKLVKTGLSACEQQRVDYRERVAIACRQDFKMICCNTKVARTGIVNTELKQDGPSLTVNPTEFVQVGNNWSGTVDAVS